MTAEAAQGATYWPGDEQLALLPPAAPVLTELTAVERTPRTERSLRGAGSWS
jgi:hypothetical protein